MRNVGDLTRSSLVKAVMRVLYYLVPNFHNFNAIAAAGHGDLIPFSLIWQNTIYATLYVIVILLASSAVFSRRNLK
jgi:hypothetical protein